jgi:hypothetical protein
MNEAERIKNETDLKTTKDQINYYSIVPGVLMQQGIKRYMGKGIGAGAYNTILSKSPYKILDFAGGIAGGMGTYTLADTSFNKID